jgi:hypothetical protein
MRYIEAPEEFDGVGPSLFLAGGITGCPKWQPEMAPRFRSTKLTVLNPMRLSFDTGDPRSAEEQIEWEFRHLRMATAKLFWFPDATLCPITLYELGAWSRTNDPLFIGVHPKYDRKKDVEIQTRLIRPDVIVVDSLEELTKQVLAWCSTQNYLLG